MTSPKLLALAAVTWLPVALAAAQESPPAAAPTGDVAAVSFTKQVAPILLANCVACHGPQEPKGDYQLFSYETALKDEAMITPGKPDESQLYLLITEADPEVRMPKEADALAQSDMALIKQWIEQGAKFDGPDPKAPLAQIVPKLPHPAPPEAYRVPIPVTAAAFHPAGTELAVGGYNEITIWNPADGTLLRRIKNVAQRTYGLAYNAAGTLLAAASGVPGQSGEAMLFDPASGSVVKDLVSLPDVAFDVAFNAAGDKLAACAADRSIRIFDVASGNQEVLIEDHADWVMAIAWSPDGTRLASASRDKTSKVFDAKTGDSQTTYPGHGEAVFGVAWNADGTQVITAGRDKKIHIWNPADGKLAGEIAGFGHDVYDVVFRAAGIFSCSADKSVRQHTADKREQVRIFAGHNDWVYTLAVHEGTKRLASGGFDGEVRIWNIDDGASVATFFAAPRYVAKPSSEQASAAK